MKKARKPMVLGACPKCKGEKWVREELHMSGKGGRSYYFDVFVCEDCGYCELFYSKKTWVE